MRLASATLRVPVRVTYRVVIKGYKGRVKGLQGCGLGTAKVTLVTFALHNGKELFLTCHGCYNGVVDFLLLCVE